MPPLLEPDMSRMDHGSEHDECDFIPAYRTRSGRASRPPQRYTLTSGEDDESRMDPNETTPHDCIGDSDFYRDDSLDMSVSAKSNSSVVTPNRPDTAGSLMKRRRKGAIGDASDAGFHENQSVPLSGRSRQRHPRRFFGSDTVGPSKWLISPDHRIKVLWDVITVVISLVNAYLTHQAIRDRSFTDNSFLRFSEVWFVCDILLNFFTIQRRDDFSYDTVPAVAARYLTSWFVFDLLSLIPGEYMYVKPLFDKQKARNILVKNFFRTKAVIRVSRVLRGRHLRLFGSVAKRTKHAGVGANRLLYMIIKYVPKYLLFYRNMRAVILCRVLRQVHWFRKVWRGLLGNEEKPETPSSNSSSESVTEDDEEWEVDEFLDEDSDSVHVVMYDVYDDDDDQDPF